VELTNKFRKDADTYYVEAKRSMVSSVVQIPYGMYGVLAVLGWNEAMAALFNPLYFTFLVIALAASYVVRVLFLFAFKTGFLIALRYSYVIITLGLAGPLFQIAKTVGGEVQRRVATRLREHFLEPALARPVEAREVKQEGNRSRSGSSVVLADRSRRPERLHSAVARIFYVMVHLIQHQCSLACQAALSNILKFVCNTQGFLSAPELQDNSSPQRLQGNFWSDLLLNPISLKWSKFTLANLRYRLRVLLHPSNCGSRAD